MKEINVNKYINFYVKKFTSKKGNEIVALYVKIGEHTEQLICYLPKDFDFKEVE